MTLEPLKQDLATQISELLKKEDEEFARKVRKEKWENASIMIVDKLRDNQK